MTIRTHKVGHICSSCGLYKIIPIDFEETPNGASYIAKNQTTEHLCPSCNTLTLHNMQILGSVNGVLYGLLSRIVALENKLKDNVS